MGEGTRQQTAATKVRASSVLLFVCVYVRACVCVSMRVRVCVFAPPLIPAERHSPSLPCSLTVLYLVDSADEPVKDVRINVLCKGITCALCALFRLGFCKHLSARLNLAVRNPLGQHVGLHPQQPCGNWQGSRSKQQEQTAANSSSNTNNGCECSWGG